MGSLGRLIYRDGRRGIFGQDSSLNGVLMTQGTIVLPVLSFRVIEAGLMIGGDVLAAIFAMCQRVSRGLWNDMTLRSRNSGFLDFECLKLVFLLICLISHFLCFLISPFLLSVVFSSSGDILLLC
jgi:hypothetical protein